MNDKKRAAFWEYVEGRLTVAQFKELHAKLDISDYKWTALQTGSKDFSLEQLNIVSDFLGLPVATLINKYGLGTKRLTIEEVMEIAQAGGEPITFAAAV